MVEVQIIVVDSTANIIIKYLNQTAVSHVRSADDIYMSISYEIKAIIKRMDENAVKSIKRNTKRSIVVHE